MISLLKHGFRALCLVTLIIGCKVEQPVMTSEDTTANYSRIDTLPEIEVLEPEPRVYHASRTRLFDLLHTRLEISLDWDQQRANGLALLHLRPYFYPQDKLLLDAKNFDIHYVQLVRGTEKTDLDYFYDTSQLLINLDKVYTREDDLFIRIKYTAKPTEHETGGSMAIESDQGLYFINHDGSDPDKPMQVWTQGETESNSNWFPTIDSPNERMTQEIFLTVNEKYVTLSNGELVYSKFNGDSTRTDYWRMDKSHAPYLAMIAVGEFEVIEDTWNGIPLYYYIEPEYAEYARDIFGATPEMMTFFSDLIGIDYPWNKYAQIIVRDYVSGAMENTTASLFYDALLVDRRELLDENHEGIIAHELFHQWFGDLVTLESWANLTLNEGFANYSEYLWNEYKYGKYEAGLHDMEERMQYLKEAEVEQKDLIRFYYEDKDDMFDSHSYAKGGRIMHMLRNYVGDDAFFTALNLYLKRYEYQAVEVHQLRLIFEEVTGEDLNWFFNQWFLASGHPELEVRDNYADSILTLSVRQLQDLSTTPLYRLPVKFDVWTKDQKIQYELIIDKKEQMFEFELAEEPQLVVFDSDHQLLAEIDHPKSMKEYFLQYNLTDDFLPRYLALDTLLKDVNDSLSWHVMKDAIQDEFWFFRQMAVNALENYDKPDKHEIEGILSELAANDEKSQVRADALNILYSLTGDKYNELYMSALNDSSYLVAGTAIYVYSATSPQEMAKVAGQFDQYDNINIVIPLASFYIDRGGYQKFEWFVDKIKAAKSETLWYLLQYFGEYIMDAPELVQRRGIAVLERYARGHSKNYVRLSAYQSLGLLTELTGVRELREDIRKQEEDRYLRQLYGSLP
ncbi:MAG: M1 family metallopeptidase [Cyclobacteriaceae bacterium]|nr:M1 family metallopeptidase [Cyclobacteriaceae bacterium]